MRLLLIIAVVIGLAACTVPSRDFRGIPAQRITVEGSVFDVRIRGERAEAVRVNTQYAPRFGPIRGRAGIGERVRGERGLGRSGAGRWRVGLRLEGACCG
mgnify:CR=1 FL=1